MFLDFRNNELIFSRIASIPEFKRDLQAMKGIKYRDYKNRFYISLSHFNVVRQVLSQKYKGKIGFSLTYEKFAKRFVLNKEVIHIKWTPDICYIQGANIPWEEIIPITSYFDKRAKNSKQYGKSWSGYSHLFNAIEGEFPSGLLERIIKVLEKQKIPFQVERTFDYPKPYIDLTPVFSFTPTEDQINAVNALSDANYGIGKLPTGFGKTSYVAASLIARKGVRSIFLANQRILIDDAKKDFEQVFKNDILKIGMIGDGIFDPGDITVASIQSIAASLTPPTKKEEMTAWHELELAKQRMKLSNDEDTIKDVKKATNRVNSINKRIERHKQLIPYLQSVDLFIVDEAQVLGTEQWKQFLSACPAPYRYTLSATDTRTDGGRIEIVAATGERRYVATAEEQIEKGRLSEFVGHFVKFDHKIDKNVLRNLKVDYHHAYNLFIVQNEKRNRHLCDKVIEWANDYSVLALVTRKEHGEIVRQMLAESGLNSCHYIDGDTPKKIRKDTIEAFRNGEFSVLIGTSIFDVGFNAKNASKIVRFNAGGSEVREPQRAGRTVRIRDDGSIGESYDILDVNVPYFESQGWKRMLFLKNEFGSSRVRVHKEIIEGELNVVALKEIVAAIPEETDREKGEEIIQQLQQNEWPTDEEKFPELNEEELEPNLQSLLTELTSK